MWTLFWDMHSGGGTKVAPFEKIYIEAPKSEAELVFYNRFGRNPYRVTCTCCGEDYSVDESPTLERASAFHRGCDYDENGPTEQKGKNSFNEYQTLDEYIARPDVLVIRADEIKPEERTGRLPKQGYVWVDD